MPQSPEVERDQRIRKCQAFPWQVTHTASEDGEISHELFHKCYQRGFGGVRELPVQAEDLSSPVHESPKTK